MAQGRAADDVRIFNMATVITGRDEAAAGAKLADYRRYVSAESVLVGFSGGSGIDLGKYGLDEPLRYEKTEAVQSIMHRSLSGVNIAYGFRGLRRGLWPRLRIG